MRVNFYRSPSGVIQEYNEDLAEAQLIVFSIRKGSYSDESIRFLAKYYSYKKEGKQIEGVFIITDKHLLYVRDLQKILFKCKIRDITLIDTFAEGMDVTTGNSIHHLKIKTAAKGYEFLSDKHYDIAKAAEVIKS